MRSQLPYKVECKSTYPFFETIAAFDCYSPASAYALDCGYINTSYTYRVVKGRKVLFEIAQKYAVIA